MIQLCIFNQLIGLGFCMHFYLYRAKVWIKEDKYLKCVIIDVVMLSIWYEIYELFM